MTHTTRIDLAAEDAVVPGEYGLVLWHIDGRGREQAMGFPGRPCVLVGSGRACTIRTVDPHHAMPPVLFEIDCHGNGARLRVVAPEPAVLVGGRSAREHRVQPGDVIAFGRHRLWVGMVGGRVAPLAESIRDCRKCGRAIGLAAFLDGRVAAPESGPFCLDCYEAVAGIDARRIDGFEILDWLGGGGMGNVYKARDLKLHVTRALKLMRGELAADEGFRRRFFQEVASEARVGNHPNIVSCHATGECAGALYAVFDYVDGRPLDKIIAERAPLPVGWTLRLFRQLLQGLDACYAAGVLHRDVKPANILVDRAERLYLTDFGLARVVVEEGTRLSRGPRPTLPGTAMGTFAYAAPEQLADAYDADSHADIYGAGATLYHALAGQEPFWDLPLRERFAGGRKAEPVALAEQRPALPEALCRVVHRAMAHRPEDRYETPGHMLRAIDVVLQELE